MLSSLEQARAGERRFLADASHELRTPVTALLGNVEYAARHGADAEVLDELRHDAARLARLVDALLALERAGGDVAGAASRSTSTSWCARRSPSTIAGGCGRRAAATGRPCAATRRRCAARSRNLIENGLVHGPPDGHGHGRR